MPLFLKLRGFFNTERGFHGEVNEVLVSAPLPLQRILPRLSVFYWGWVGRKQKLHLCSEGRSIAPAWGHSLCPVTDPGAATWRDQNGSSKEVHGKLLLKGFFPPSSLSSSFFLCSSSFFLTINYYQYLITSYCKVDKLYNFNGWYVHCST